MDYRELIKRLSVEYEAGEARAVLRLLLEEEFSLRWTDVLCGELDSLSLEQQEKLESMIARLESGDPVQYVLQKADFYGRTFHVAPGVLIPRPETEMLVQEVLHTSHYSLLSTLYSLHSPLSTLSTLHSPLSSILDIGTGSGCIAITLALECPQTKVTGWDVSAKALAIARKNAAMLGAENISFAEVDILSHEAGSDERWSVIVSNPPYICDKERKEMDRHVLEHEPSLALFVPDDNPLRFYRRIAEYAFATLISDGYLFFEINREYGKDVAEMLKNHGFIDVFVKKDQFDNDRIVTARRP